MTCGPRRRSLALDVHVEPSFGAATIDDPLRKRGRGVREREDPSGPSLSCPVEPERDVLLAAPVRRRSRRRPRAARCAGTRESCVLSCVNRMACADHEVAAQRQPVLAELALVAVPRQQPGSHDSTASGDSAVSTALAARRAPLSTRRRRTAAESCKRQHAKRDCGADAAQMAGKNGHRVHCCRASGRLIRRFCGLSRRR